MCYMFFLFFFFLTFYNDIKIIYEKLNMNKIIIVQWVLWSNITGLVIIIIHYYE